MKENIKNIIVVLLIILGGGAMYSLHVKDITEIPDIKRYEKTIDSLNNVLLINKREIARFDSLTNIQESKIKTLTTKLGNIAVLAAKEHKQHEEDIKRIGVMSNNDITTLFTASFN